MNLRYFLALCASLLNVSFSNGSNIPASKNPNPNEKVVGIMNPYKHCYINAFLTATFNIPIFREALYASEPVNCSTFMLAQTFAKIENSSAAISMEDDFIPAIKSDFGWETIMNQCISEFSTGLLERLPESVKKLFELNVILNYKRQDNMAVLKSEYMNTSHIIVHPDSLSVSDAIFKEIPINFGAVFDINEGNHYKFRNSVPEYNQTPLKINAVTRTQILNRPEFFVVVIPRSGEVVGNINSNPMALNEEIMMPRLKKEKAYAEESKGDTVVEEEYEIPVRYLLKSFCYHVTPGHFATYARTFSTENPRGQWFNYDDEVMTPVKTNPRDIYEMFQIANTYASLAFYVREDAAEKDYLNISAPLRYKSLAQLQLALDYFSSQKKNAKKFSN